MRVLNLAYLALAAGKLVAKPIKRTTHDIHPPCNVKACSQKGNSEISCTIDFGGSERQCHPPHAMSVLFRTTDPATQVPMDKNNKSLKGPNPAKENYLEDWTKEYGPEAPAPVACDKTQWHCPPTDLNPKSGQSAPMAVLSLAAAAILA